MSKHPELDRHMLSPGVSYACAYMRLEHGWPLDRAISEAPRKKGPRRERRPFRDRVAKRVLSPRTRPTTRKQYIRYAEDTSPDHIRRLRAKFCTLFIKTGVLDPTMAAQLKDYADEQRATEKHPDRVPVDNAGRRYRQKEQGAGDNGLRDGHQIDGPTAGRIAHFMRSQ